MGGGLEIPRKLQSFHQEEKQISSRINTETQQEADQIQHSLPSNTKNPVPIRLLTHNIRYATAHPFPHEQLWPRRLPQLLAQLHHYASTPFNPLTTLLCFQEVLHVQLLDLTHALGPEWSHFGVGRDDGGTVGEFEPVFWRDEVWELVHSETLWLHQWDTTRPPPWDKRRQHGQPGWGGGSVRVCTCVVLDLKQRTPSSAANTETLEPFRLMVLNTHLDDQSEGARRKGAALIVQHARRWRETFRATEYVLTGDLNSDPDENHGMDNGAWCVLNARDSGFVDVRRLLEPSASAVEAGSLNEYKHYGHDLTFTGFNGRGDGDGIKRLDFVHYGVPVAQKESGNDKGDEEHLGNELCKKLHSFAVLPNLFDDGVRCSDHRAVVVNLLL